MRKVIVFPRRQTVFFKIFFLNLGGSILYQPFFPVLKALRSWCSLTFRRKKNLLRQKLNEGILRKQGNREFLFYAAISHSKKFPLDR